MLIGFVLNGLHLIEELDLAGGETYLFELANNTPSAVSYTHLTLPTSDLV